MITAVWTGPVFDSYQMLGLTSHFFTRINDFFNIFLEFLLQIHAFPVLETDGASFYGRKIFMDQVGMAFSSLSAEKRVRDFWH